MAYRAIIIALLVGPFVGVISAGTLCSLLFGNDLFFERALPLSLLGAFLSTVVGIPLGLFALRKKLNLIGVCAFGGGFIGIILGSLYNPASMYIVSTGVIAGIFCGGATSALYKSLTSPEE